jgi:hypothetical protein
MIEMADLRASILLPTSAFLLIPRKIIGTSLKKRMLKTKWTRQ